MINQLNLSDLETRVTSEEPKPEGAAPSSAPAPAPVVVWTLPLGARTCPRPKCGFPMERRNTYYPPREPGQPVEPFGYVTLTVCTNPDCDHREAN